MIGTNVYKALIELLPQNPLLLAEVAAVYADGTLTVQFPGGGLQRVRGAGFATGAKVFVRSGMVEGLAPNLSAVTIEV
jgi:hypothetical protein